MAHPQNNGERLRAPAVDAAEQASASEQAAENRALVERFVLEHAELASRLRAISAGELARYNVKRGLRNADGTGVLAGLTEIGDVHGYVLDEGEKTPVEGRLSYRGIDVKNIVSGFTADRRFGFEETVFLLLFGELPTAEKLADFQVVLAERREPPDGFWQDIVMRYPSSDLMNKIGRVVLGAYAYDATPEDHSIPNIVRQSIDLIARFPLIAAYAYQSKRKFFDHQSLFVHAPNPELSTAENLLQMIRPDQKFTRLEAEVLDLSLVLHAEHGGGNNSAFTVHVVSSAFTDTYAAISAAVGSLKGARHGGANIQVWMMMEELKRAVGDWADEDEIARYLERLLRKEVGDRSGLIYGMGHAIYTLSDPRAVLLKAKARELTADDPTYAAELDLYERVERVCPGVFSRVKNDKKAISANVDFYSGLVYQMLNIPQDLFTPIFAISRVAGWCAHRIEEIAAGSRIIRPAYKNVLGRRPYVRLADRQVNANR